MSSSFSSKLHYFSLLYIAFTIPFQWKYLPFSAGIIFLVLIWIIDGKLFQKLKIAIRNRFTILFSGLYLLYLISLLYSENKEYAYTDLLLKLPLFLIPIIFSSSKKLNKLQFILVLKIFAISTFIAAFTTFFIGYFNYINTGLIKYFFYHNLETFMHTSYTGMYTCFAICIFMYLIENSKNKKVKAIYFILVFSLMWFLFLLSSRMQIIIYAFLLTSYIIWVFQKKRILLGSLILLIGYSCLALGIIKLPKTNDRFEQTKAYITNKNYTKTNTDARIKIWKAAFDVIKKNILIGTGVGDVKDVLIAQYLFLSGENIKKEKIIENKIDEIKNNKDWFEHIKEKAKENNLALEDQLYLDATYVLDNTQNRYFFFVKQRYNYHCQYLQTFSAIGILGIVCLILSFLIPLYKIGIKSKNYLLLTFFFIVAMSFITESMLERQAGVIFYAFFSSLLVYNSELNTNDRLS